MDRRRGEKHQIFLPFGKQNKSKTTVKHVNREDGSVAHSDKDILEEQYIFFKYLYEDDNITKNEIHTYLNENSPSNILNENTKSEKS